MDRRIASGRGRIGVEAGRREHLHGHVATMIHPAFISRPLYWTRFMKLFLVIAGLCGVAPGQTQPAAMVTAAPVEGMTLAQAVERARLYNQQFLTAGIT